MDATPLLSCRTRSPGADERRLAGGLGDLAQTESNRNGMLSLTTVITVTAAVEPERRPVVSMAMTLSPLRCRFSAAEALGRLAPVTAGHSGEVLGGARVRSTPAASRLHRLSPRMRHPCQTCALPRAGHACLHRAPPPCADSVPACRYASRTTLFGDWSRVRFRGKLQISREGRMTSMNMHREDGTDHRARSAASAAERGDEAYFAKCEEKLGSFPTCCRPMPSTRRSCAPSPTCTTT
jgi:hypothetical protein